MKGKFIDLY